MPTFNDPVTILGDGGFGGVIPPTSITLGNIPYGDSSASLGDEPASSSLTDIARMITESQTYKEAYSVLSSDKKYGTPYLEQLIAVPESYSMRSENFWDTFTELFGGTSEYEKLLTDSFNSAMTDIRTIMTNYRNFINSLPKTQIEQQEEAGYNAAITGEGVDGSSLFGASSSGSGGIGASSAPSMASYNNEGLSKGIESFVSFIGAVSSLATAGASVATAAKTIEQIDQAIELADREAWNKQQLHDYMLATLGLVNDSPYAVLGSNETVKNVADVASAEAAASAKALNSNVNVPIPGDTDEPTKFTNMSGRDVLDMVSRFNLISRYSQTLIDMIDNNVSAQFSELVSLLENQSNVATMSGQIAEGEFNRDYFEHRNGITEGVSMTSIKSSMAAIRESEAYLKDFEAWLTEWKQNEIYNWGTALNENPSLSPFFYKALFDFDMTDTFYHQSAWSQGLKYGLDSLEKMSGIVGTFLGRFGAPKPRVSRTHRTRSGRYGFEETVETITE